MSALSIEKDSEMVIALVKFLEASNHLNDLWLDSRQDLVKDYPFPVCFNELQEGIQKWVQTSIKSIYMDWCSVNTKTKELPANILARHVLAMQDDVYLSGHPEWNEIVAQANNFFESIKSSK